MFCSQNIFAQNSKKFTYISQDKKMNKILINNSVVNYMKYKKAQILLVPNIVKKKSTSKVLLREYLLDCDDLRIRDIDVKLFDMKTGKSFIVQHKEKFLKKGWRDANINGFEGNLLEKVCTK